MRTGRNCMRRKPILFIFGGTIALGLMAAGMILPAPASAAEDSIKICVIDDASGDFALAVVPKTQGAQLAVDDINAKGGVLGKKLELIHYDGQSDVKRHQEFAQRCVLQDKANVVMAGYTSSEREAARSVVAKS